MEYDGMILDRIILDGMGYDTRGRDSMSQGWDWKEYDGWDEI